MPSELCQGKDQLLQGYHKKMFVLAMDIVAATLPRTTLRQVSEVTKSRREQHLDTRPPAGPGSIGIVGELSKQNYLRKK